MAQFLISTTGVVTLADLGNRILSSGLNSVDIGTEFAIEELRYSADLASAIQAGTLSVDDDGRGRSITGPVSNAIATAFVSNIFHYDDADVSEVIALTNIDELNDVTLTSPILNGEALVYNSGSGQWENQAVAGGVSSVNSQTGVVVLDTDDISDTASTNKYFTNALARGAISIAPGSTTHLGYNSGTGELSVSALAITTVDVFGTYTSLAAFVAGEYGGSPIEFQEGDVIILPDATGGTLTYIHNGGVAATAADFTLIQQPNVDQTTVRGWFSAGTGLAYEASTGVFSLTNTAVTLGSYGSASEVATFTVNAKGQLTAAASTSISITASQVSDFNTAASTEIFEAANFVDGTTIDFTVNTGASVTAEVIANSIQANELAVTGNGTAGQFLASDGDGTFTWTATKKTWSWGASSSASNTTNRYLDRHDGVPTNQSPYVAWYACELRAISFATASASTWTAEVYVNGSSVATLASGGSQYGQSTELSVSIAAGDRVALYVNGTGVDRPSIDALFEEV